MAIRQRPYIPGETSLRMPAGSGRPHLAPPFMPADNSTLTWSPRPEDCQTAATARIYQYWRDCRGTRPFPARADLDPLSMRVALGNIALIEVHRDPLRFRIRLIGTDQVERLGFDPTGLWLDAIPTPEYARLLIARLTEIVARPEPLLVRNRQLLDHRWYDYEALWLPLGSDGRTLDMVLACQIFTDSRS